MYLYGSLFQSCLIGEVQLRFEFHSLLVGSNFELKRSILSSFQSVKKLVILAKLALEI